MNRIHPVGLMIGLLGAGLASAERAEIPDRSGDPYRGAIAVEAASGKVLFEDRADEPAYPASTIKLMNLMIILDQVKEGALRLDDPVTVTAEASQMGGSQVYLKEHETFTVEELLYAMIVQSANDAATALALRVAGSREAFVQRMNLEAQRIGMSSTRFFSVHGLPPTLGQSPDVTTARDLALLCRHLLRRHPDAVRFTGTRERGFRNDTFTMRSHNPLLWVVPGCDGLKTGYFKLAGYSIAATAERNGRRAIVVVLGSTRKDTRNARTADLLNRALAP